jgi:FtsZ-interacting cell division protein ZipA
MQRQPLRRVERPPSRKARDVLILLIGVAILVLAIVGLASSVAYFAGFQVNAASTKTITKTKVIAPNPTTLNRARAQATAIVKAAESEANKRSAAIQHAAQAKARKVLRQARQQAQHQRQNPTPAPTSFVQPTPVAQPTSASTAPTQTTNNQTGAPLPNLNSVPSSWSVVAYGANPTAHTVNLFNRSSGSFSGTITLTYLNSKGKSVGEAQGQFTQVPGHTSVVVPLTVKRAASNWARYLVNVSNVH